ncbi:MAG: glucuronate isomerase [Acutalibacteraceae bacterium]|jgi:glucuronate isomerase
MNRDFFLTTDAAKQLYKVYAKDLPIIDYHNHLSIPDISENKRYLNITDLWISPDPYKHRAMRMCGLPERLITGDSTDKEKFTAWCEIFPKLVGNPLYIWSLMELSVIFGIVETPNAQNAEEIYKKANDCLAQNETTPSTFFDKFKVEYAGPCASLCDDLVTFENSTHLAPSLRGDNIVEPTAEFIKTLSEKTGINIKSLDDLKAAICARLDRFHAVGCRFSDHALDNGFSFIPDDGKNGKRFEALLNGESLTKEDKKSLQCSLIVFLGSEYAKRNWTMQLHIGAARFTSTRLRALAGAAGGYAAIGNSTDVSSLLTLLDTLEQNGGLPKTILFPLNPADNALISVISGSYSKDNMAGLITQGPAWWWCDHKQGILDVLENTAAFGVLANFAGMTTDSRSFLSLVRHDYFRRVLCGWLGEKLEKGEFPLSISELGQIVNDICYLNAKKMTEVTNY